MSESPVESVSLNDLPELPPQNRRSLWFVLGVQSLNAFNDNFVKMLLIAFAGAVAHGTDLGDSMQVYLGAIFSVPYIFFAPLAGWLSDRYSKQRVIVWMQMAQVIVFAGFIAAIALHQANLTLYLSLLAFFLLATQAAFFSPAKMGIIKELVGDRRLGSANGMLQMTMFLGILSGMWAGGSWFGMRLAELNDPWSAVWVPMLVVSVLALLQIPGALAVQRTPEHTEVKFHSGVLFEHFTHLKLVFGNRPIKLAAFGVSYFWFMSNAVGSILVTLSHERHVGNAAEASAALSTMAAMLGLGVILGSAVASLASRRKIELGIVPLAGIGMALATLAAGLSPHQGPMVYFAMVGIGFSGGAFMTPLYAFVQNRCAPEELARVLSAMNLMDCIASIIANLAVVKVMLLMKVPATTQLVVLSPLAIIAAIYMTRLLSQDFLRFILLTIVRSVYDVKAVNLSQVPKTGGVLLLPNHVSYVDALLIGAACDRKVRFVMWDVLYNIKWLTWFLRIVGTVPISATRAKDAIRSVGGALKEGQIVCLFPEGQITRHGMFNELRKGFELMARQGDALVVPVYLEGIYGSIFSFEGGTFFKKWPKSLRYPVSVHFGVPMTAREATAEAVSKQWYDLTVAALDSRALGYSAVPNAVPQATANALRLMEIEWARTGDTLLCLAAPGSAIHQTLTAYARIKPDIHVVMTAEAVAACAQKSVIAIGTAADMSRIQSIPDWARVGKFVLCWDSVEAATPEAADVYRGLMDSGNGALVTASVPDPIMPAGEEGNQVGRRAGSLGHLLPGALTQVALQELLTANNLTLTVDHFLTPATPPPPAQV
jgi:acyl-[acyl-carrier-protein]-phospholipid O-acyltransferase / long-chain-fatty-acid--[acyl-carrier-protein] ligase